MAILSVFSILDHSAPHLPFRLGLLQTLSREKSLAQRVSVLEREAEDREELIQTLKSEKTILSSELTRALEDKEVAEEESHKAKEESDVVRDDAVRLERLVQMLRSKLERREDRTMGRNQVILRHQTFTFP